MGNCVTSRQASTERQSRPIGRNQTLKTTRARWKSDVALTTGQLRSKRDEFWDTAPAFEGRSEIWAALRAAVDAISSDDFPLAQAILDGANVTLPNGTLTDCYDELGNRYQLPIYVLSQPTNLILTVDSENCSGGDHGGASSCKSVRDRQSSATSSSRDHAAAEVGIRLRLSTGKDVKLSVKTTYSIRRIKKMVEAQEHIPVPNQRWFYGGKLLTDKLTIGEMTIPAGYVIQVIVINDEVLTHPPATTTADTICQEGDVQ